MRDYYVVVREDGRFVAKSGMEHSYTKDITQARLFATHEAAKADCCGNENIRKLSEYFQE